MRRNPPIVTAYVFHLRCDRRRTDLLVPSGKLPPPEAQACTSRLCHAHEVNRTWHGIHSYLTHHHNGITGPDFGIHDHAIGDAVRRVSCASNACFRKSISWAAFNLVKYGVTVYANWFNCHWWFPLYRLFERNAIHSAVR